METLSVSFSGHCCLILTILEDGERDPSCAAMALEQNQIQPKAEPKPYFPSSGIVPALNPERWLEDYGDMLFGFAMVRIRDRGVAQELVQETFLAALRASQSFAGRSTERAWLFGILRNKLADHYRIKSGNTLGRLGGFQPRGRRILPFRWAREGWLDKAAGSEALECTGRESGQQGIPGSV